MEENKIDLLEKEYKELIELLREIKFGEVTIHMRSGKPYRVVEIRESKLIGDKSGKTKNEQ
jgi:hypothetical protein